MNEKETAKIALPVVLAAAAKIDEMLNDLRSPLLVPALAVLVGRYVAYEAGHPDRMSDGLHLAWAAMREAAIEEACKLYAPKETE